MDCKGNRGSKPKLEKKIDRQIDQVHCKPLFSPDYDHIYDYSDLCSFF